MTLELISLVTQPFAPPSSVLFDVTMPSHLFALSALSAIEPPTEMLSITLYLRGLPRLLSESVGEPCDAIRDRTSKKRGM
jgi:hypothetical protein